MFHISGSPNLDQLRFVVPPLRIQDFSRFHPKLFSPLWKRERGEGERKTIGWLPVTTKVIAGERVKRKTLPKVFSIPLASQWPELGHTHILEPWT